MKITKTPPNEESTVIKVRTKETSTQLLTCYYEVEQILPFNWGRMGDDEKQHWLQRNATMVSREVEDVKSNIDGVFNSWGNSNSEYTVTFTYTASEVVRAMSREDAVIKARKILATQYQSPAQVIEDADVDIWTGNDVF